MIEAKIDIKIGEIQFSGQGDQEWVGKQLDKILAQAEALIQLVPVSRLEQTESLESAPMGKDSTIAKKSLSAFLEEKGAKKYQVKKFLTTAIWLEAKGQSKIQTSDVTKALKDSQQTKLANPTVCLNQNTKKGYCVKDGKQFYVTEDGKKS